MDENEIRRGLMEILYCTLNETSADASFHETLTTEAITSIYALAKKHSLSHLVSRYLFENELLPDENLAKSLRCAGILMARRHEMMKRTFDEICHTFEDAKIDYIPLKGSVIRLYYPEEDMRTSCDIDILIHEEDLNRATSILKSRGYSGGERHYHDVSLHSPTGIHLELHFNILENIDRLDAVLKNAWEYATPISGCRYEFSQSFFVFHMYSHMAYHFLSGGCGIRSLMDIWIMEHKMNADYTCARELLQKAGIETFAREMSQLANQCFANHDPSDSLLEYIWLGGVYGSTRNRSIIQKKRTSSVGSYLLKRIFLPYQSMTVLYPILKKIPPLLPFCWVHRWIRAIIKGKTRHFTAEVTQIHNVSEDDVAEIEALYARLGL